MLDMTGPRLGELACESGLQRAVHAAEQPAEPQSYGNGGVRLRFDRVAERAFERSRRLPCRIIGSIG
jgi:hypothetical protein